MSLLLAVDAHVHAHAGFALDRLLDAAGRGLDAAGMGRPVLPVLLFAGTGGADGLDPFRPHVGGLVGRWQIRSTAEDASLLAGCEGVTLMLVGGRQIATRERLEVLALGARTDVPEGLTFPQTLARAAASGAVTVVPWGFGKWTGARGRQVRGAVLDPPGPIFLGDNGGRLRGTASPPLFAEARERGIWNLPGSDPLPFPGQVRRAGSRGFLVEGALDPLQPAAGLRRILLGLPRQPELFGTGVGPGAFLISQLRMQLMTRARGAARIPARGDHPHGSDEEDRTMRVLGITTGGDCGAAVVEDGRVLAAVNEERLVRIKLAEGFPRESIRSVLRLTGTSVGELDAVLVAATSSIMVDQVREPDVWLEGWGSAGSGGLVKGMAGALSPLRRRLPFLEKGYYALLQPTFRERREAIERILRDELEVRAPISFVDHHFCHLTSAYFTSGYEDALVVSLDGGGDGRSGLIYEVRDGAFRYVTEMSSYDSLGNYYAYATILCGFKAMRHEGKITGLAAHGRPVHVDLLKEFVDERDGQLENRGGVVFKRAIRELARRLPRGWKKEDLAASIQRHFEDVTRRIVRHWLRRTGQRNVAVAGGVFANVRVNEEVHALPEVDGLFVHPHMGDGGLAVGAALAPCVPGTLERTMAFTPEPMRDVYLGPGLSDEEVDGALRGAGLAPVATDQPLAEAVAELLVGGFVVARASGRMEYGPRALGNRSILYHPTDRSVNDWLNKNLHRTEFMPFAPSLLAEEADRCFENVGGAHHAAEFMTSTFRATPWMARAMEGVIHIDGTARPQLVRRDRNAEYYDIIAAFRRRTGLPAVINTSFNMHEEPIVCSADDCVRAFLGGNLDYLAIGRHLVKHPRALTHALRPARASDPASAGREPAPAVGTG